MQEAQALSVRKVTPFLLYGITRREQIRQKLAALLESWSADWLAGPGLHLEFRNVTGARDPMREIAGDQSVLLGNRESGALIVISLNGKLNPLLQCMPDVNRSREVESDLTRQLRFSVGRRCALALFGLLTTGKTGVADMPRDEVIGSSEMIELCRPGSGWGVLSLEAGENSLSVLLGPPVLQQIIDARVKPQPRGDLKGGLSALANQRIVVCAELGATSLTIGEIRNLAAGDVIKLDQPCDTPIRLTVGTGKSIASARLGMQSGYKAVKLKSQ